MFNIAPQFYATLALPLCLCVMESLCYAFRFPSASLSLRASGIRFSLRSWRFNLAFAPQRQPPRLFPPRVCHYGGAPLFSAVRCGARVANRQRAPAFPPYISAAKCANSAKYAMPMSPKRYEPGGSTWLASNLGGKDHLTIAHLKHRIGSLSPQRWRRECG